jgi:hypothetical protein
MINKEKFMHPAVGVFLENENGSVFEIVGFEWDFPVNGVRPRKKILKQVFKNGSYGDKNFLYTDEELIEKMIEGKIKPIKKPW